MRERRMRVAVRVWLLGLVPLFVAACVKTSTRPPDLATATAAPALTPTATTAAATATPDVPPVDLCRDYLDLFVRYGEAEAIAVPTSYRCHRAYIDATGRSPGPPDLIVHRGVPVDLELAVRERPTEVEVRLYPGAGVAASFMRWPEELPTQVKAIDRFLAGPDTRVQYVAQAPPGPYSLNVKVTWAQDVEVYYAISLMLEEPAMPTHTLEPTSVPVTPTPMTLTLDPEQAPDGIVLDVVEQIGGQSLAVAAEQGQIYLGIGPRLVVLDGPFAETGPRRIGQSEVLPGMVEEIQLVGNLAYVAAGEAGLIVLDVADSSSIQPLSVISTQGNALSVFVEPTDGLAYVASSEGFGAEQSGRLDIVDVSLPERPEWVASVEMPGPAYDVAVVGRYAYITYADGLVVVNVSDPLAPIEVANVEVPQGARALAVAGGHAYVAGYGLHVFDVSDPALPRRVGRFESTFSAYAVAVQDRYVYLADTFCEMGHCGSTISIVGLADPARLQEVGAWKSKSAVEDLFVHEDRLYVASRQKGVQVVDVSDPAQIRLLGEYATLADVEDVVVSGRFGYVSDEAQSGLQVLDLDGSSGLSVRGTAESTRWAGGYAVKDGYAYLPVWADGFRIVNVDDPDDPREVVALELGMAEQAVVVGKRAYVTVGYEGLAVLDIADPSAPQVLGRLPLEGLVEGLAVAGDRAYVTVDGGEENTLRVIDIADPLQPGERGRVALKGKGLNVALGPSSRHVYVAVANCAYHQCSGGLQGIDVRDPFSPRTVAWVEIPGGVWDVAVTGEHAFVAAGLGGVWVLDISDPERLSAVGWRDTAGRARSIVVDGGRAYVADGPGGLLVLQTSWSGPPESTQGQSREQPSNEPQITSFSVVPTEVEPGDVITLSWEARGDRATICPSARFALYKQDDCWPVSPSGRMTFTLPMQTGGNRAIDLRLTVAAEGAADPAVWQTSVAFKCHRTWFFSDERPAGICPLKAIESHAAAQRFERGTMIWVEQIGRYIVLDETPLDGDGRWKRVAYAQDPLDVGKDTSAGFTAPGGLYAPTLGFGFVWRGDVSGLPGYRETLGWALAPEFGYETIWQCDDALPSGGRSWQTCVLRGPEGEVIVLDPLDRWKLWDESILP